MEKILDFLLRIILGVLTIVFVNLVLEGVGVPTVVGVNSISVLTCGILGFPGLVVLYVFGFYRVL